VLRAINQLLHCENAANECILEVMRRSTNET